MLCEKDRDIDICEAYHQLETSRTTKRSSAGKVEVIYHLLSSIIAAIYSYHAHDSSTASGVSSN